MGSKCEYPPSGMAWWRRHAGGAARTARPPSRPRGGGAEESRDPSADGIAPPMDRRRVLVAGLLGCSSRWRWCRVGPGDGSAVPPRPRPPHAQPSRRHLRASPRPHCRRPRVPTPQCAGPTRTTSTPATPRAWPRPSPSGARRCRPAGTRSWPRRRRALDPLHRRDRRPPGRSRRRPDRGLRPERPPRSDLAACVDRTLADARFEAPAGAAARLVWAVPTDSP